MILIFGVELLKKYLKRFSKKNVCFYDDYVKEHSDVKYGNIPFFKEWKKVDLVLVSDEFLDHQLFKDALQKKIPYQTDLNLFLQNNYDGIKVGVIGNNYKSSLFYLVKYIFGDICSISKKLYKSSLDLPLNTSYVIEISDKMINFLSKSDFKLFDILIFTDEHSYENTAYLKYQEKFNEAGKLLYYSNEQIDYPDNFIFSEYRYKLAWNLLFQMCQYFQLNLNYIKEKLHIYSYTRFKREIIYEYPLIINDSNATTIDLLFSSMSCIQTDFVLICNDFCIDIDILKQMLKFNHLKKIFLLSNRSVKFFQCESYISNNFEILVKEAFNYAYFKKYDLLFSPGGDSFKHFANFEERGKAFNLIIESLVSKV